MTNQSGTHLSSFHKGNFNSIIVENGMYIPSTSLGDTTIPTQTGPLQLSNILVTPAIVKNLVFVRCFAIDNHASVNFVPFGFSENDLTTGVTRLKCDSSGELYTVLTNNQSNHPVSPPVALAVQSSLPWHARLGHPSTPVLEFLRSKFIPGNNKENSSFICHACQVGKHHQLLFSRSMSVTSALFDIIHSDL